MKYQIDKNIVLSVLHGMEEMFQNNLSLQSYAKLAACVPCFSTHASKIVSVAIFDHANNSFYRSGNVTVVSPLDLRNLLNVQERQPLFSVINDVPTEFIVERVIHFTHVYYCGQFARFDHFFQLFAKVFLLSGQQVVHHHLQNGITVGLLA